MKKYFDFQETVTYNHSVEIEVEDEEAFEDFADQLCGEIDSGNCEDRYEVVHAFIDEYGKDKVNFIECGSPDVEIEAY